MAKEMGVPFLGRIPFEPQVVTSGDKGIPYTQAFPDSTTTRAFREAIEPIIRLLERND